MAMQRFAVEFDRRVVGVAVRVAGGFTFFASDEEFAELDGEMFDRARSIARRLEKVSSRRRKSAAAGLLALAIPPEQGLPKSRDLVPAK